MVDGLLPPGEIAPPVRCNHDAEGAADSTGAAEPDQASKSLERRKAGISERGLGV